MLGDDRGGLLGAAGGGGPEVDVGAGAEVAAKRRAHRLGLRHAGAGQRRMRLDALHPAAGVEHSLGMAREVDDGRHGSRLEGPDTNAKRMVRRMGKIYDGAAAALDGLLFDGMTLMSGASACAASPRR